MLNRRTFLAATAASVAAVSVRTIAVRSTQPRLTACDQRLSVLRTDPTRTVIGRYPALQEPRRGDRRTD